MSEFVKCFLIGLFGWLFMGWDFFFYVFVGAFFGMLVVLWNPKWLRL